MSTAQRPSGQGSSQPLAPAQALQPIGVAGVHTRCSTGGLMRSSFRGQDSVAHAVPPTQAPARTPVRPPTPEEREAVAAWLEHQQRVQQRGAEMLRVLLAVAIGVLGAVAMVHWMTPCAEGALCAWLALRWPRAGAGERDDIDDIGDSIGAYERLAYVQGCARWLE